MVEHSLPTKGTETGEDDGWEDGIPGDGGDASREEECEEEDNNVEKEADTDKED